jgi:hypothetical protein
VCLCVQKRQSGRETKRKTDRQRERQTDRQRERRLRWVWLCMGVGVCVRLHARERERGSNLFDADAAHLSDWFFEVVLKEEGEAEPFY